MTEFNEVQNENTTEVEETMVENEVNEIIETYDAEPVDTVYEGKRFNYENTDSDKLKTAIIVGGATVVAGGIVAGAVFGAKKLKKAGHKIKSNVKTAKAKHMNRKIRKAVESGELDPEMVKFIIDNTKVKKSEEVKDTETEK